MQQYHRINNSNQLNVFREIILPIFRSTRLRVTACGIMHPRCCRSVAWRRRNCLCQTGFLTSCEQEHLLLLTSCQQTCMTYTIEFRFQATGRQHRGCIKPQTVTHSLVLLKTDVIIARNMLS